MKKLLVYSLISLLTFTLSACSMNTGGDNDDKAADAAEIDPLDPIYMDQAYIDPKTGELTPGHMQESEEARKKRLAEEEKVEGQE